MGQFTIVMPAVSYARELWRFGEPELAARAAAMTPAQCVDIGERAGELSTSGTAADLWPSGPRGHTSAVLLAAIESLEGRARPCARSRRLPEKSLPDDLRLTEEERWRQAEAVGLELNRRREGA